METAGEARRLTALGVPLAQGYFFSRPERPWAAIAPAAEIELIHAHREVRSPTLHELVSPLPAITSGHLDQFASEVSGPWAAVVDGYRRPLGIVDAEAALAGTHRPTLIVNVGSSPADVIHRLSATPTDPALPVAVTDNAGRYLGLIPLRRLLGAAAASLAQVEGGDPAPAAPAPSRPT